MENYSEEGKRTSAKISVERESKVMGLNLRRTEKTLSWYKHGICFRSEFSFERL